MRIALAAFLVIFATGVSTAGGWDDRLHKTPWKFEDKSTLDWVREVAGYDITLARAGGSRVVEVSVRKQGQATVIYRWKATANTPLAIMDDTLYYVAHSEIASGARVVAVELRSGKQRWSTQLKGLGPIAHSQYRNQVWFAIEGGVIEVRSLEAGGKYIELVDLKTGKMLATRVVTP
jgi:hypothetical protein